LLIIAFSNIVELKKRSIVEASMRAVAEALRRVEKGKGVVVEPPKRNVANKGSIKLETIMRGSNDRSNLKQLKLKVQSNI
jgi:hypothetical protein